FSSILLLVSLGSASDARRQLSIRLPTGQKSLRTALPAVQWSSPYSGHHRAIDKLQINSDETRNETLYQHQRSGEDTVSVVPSAVAVRDPDYLGAGRRGSPGLGGPPMRSGSVLVVGTWPQIRG